MNGNDESSIIAKMESLNRLSLLFLLLLSLFSLLSCDSGQSPINKICTGEFKMIGVQILSMDKEPVILDEASITNVETGRVVDICEEGLGNCKNGALSGYHEEGFYFVFHDGVRDEIAGEKSKIQMQGSNEEINFSEEFQIGDNGCHVFKAAGPDTIFVDV